MSLFFRSSKKNTKQKGESYYDRENLIQNEFELCKVLRYLDSANALKTKSSILFLDNELGSVNKEYLFAEFGKESYILKPNSGISGHEIYFYHISSNGLRFLVQLHFIDDLFFFAANKVYSDMLLSDSDKEKIISRIKIKYFGEVNIEQDEMVIVDNDGNVLYTRDNVYYFIRYLANNNTSQRLKKQYEGFEVPGPGQETKSKLDRLI
jgi:hypothetical protein